MSTVRFRCDKGHEESLAMPDEMSRKAVEAFAAITVGDRDEEPKVCSWTEAVIGGPQCGAPISWWVEER
jgi:hypothetical protein